MKRRTLQFLTLALCLLMMSIIFYPSRHLPKINPSALKKSVDRFEFYPQNELQHKLIEYLKLPTIRGNEDLASQFFKNLFSSWGYSQGKIINLPGSDQRSIFAIEFSPKHPSVQKGIIFANHSDVVEFNQDLWEAPQGSLQDFFIYGRGAIDMKGMAIMQAFALKEYLASQTLKRKVLFLVLPDEETSGLGVQYFLEKFPELSQNYEYVLNEGGIGSQDIAVPGQVYNIQYAEKGLLWLDVISKTKPGHGSTPPLHYSTLQLLNFLNEIIPLHQESILTPETEIFFSELSKGFEFPKNFILKKISHPLFKIFLPLITQKNDHLRAMTQNSLSITGLNTGINPGYNRLPSKAIARLDIRLLPHQSADQHLKKLQKIAQKYDIKLQVFQKREPTKSPLQSEMMEALRKSAMKISPKALVTPLLSPGLTDNGPMRLFGLKCYGLIPIFLNEEQLKSMHGPNEKISLEQLKQGVEFLYSLLVELNS